MTESKMLRAEVAVVRDESNDKVDVRFFGRDLGKAIADRLHSEGFAIISNLDANMISVNVDFFTMKFDQSACEIERIVQEVMDEREEERDDQFEIMGPGDFIEINYTVTREPYGVRPVIVCAEEDFYEFVRTSLKESGWEVRTSHPFALYVSIPTDLHNDEQVRKYIKGYVDHLAKGHYGMD